MGFFDKLFKELTRPAEQTFKELRRVQTKILKGRRRILGDIKETIFPQPPGPAPLPIPDPPIVQGQPGTATSAQKRKLIKAGRGGTILTGQLAPKKVGKKGLLG